MEGEGIIWSVLSNFAALTALVPVARIVTDDVLPSGTLPAIQIETVSGVDRNIMNPGATIHVRQRIRIRIHAQNGASRAAVRSQVRAALFAGRFPTISGLSNVTVHTDGEGPNGLALESNVRIGIQDAIVTYSEAR